jgi:hypothetical protein
MLAMKTNAIGELITSCKYSRNHSLSVIDTNAMPFQTDILAKRSNFQTADVDVKARPSDIYSKVLCWSLHQPPISVNLSQGQNRGLFRSEIFNTLTWDQNPHNVDFDIFEYWIYRKESEFPESYFKLLAKVSGNTLSYIDAFSDISARYDYYIVSVDINGEESPWSEIIGNN